MEKSEIVALGCAVGLLLLVAMVFLVDNHPRDGEIILQAPQYHITQVIEPQGFENCVVLRYVEDGVPRSQYNCEAT